MQRRFLRHLVSKALSFFLRVSDQIPWDLGDEGMAEGVDTIARHTFTEERQNLKRYQNYRTISHTSKNMFRVRRNRLKPRTVNSCFRPSRHTVEQIKNSVSPERSTHNISAKKYWKNCEKNTAAYWILLPSLLRCEPPPNFLWEHHETFPDELPAAWANQ